MSFKWNNVFKTKFWDELSSQQVVHRLNKFSNAGLKDLSYDVDDTVKDLSDVAFSVTEAMLPVKIRFTCVEKKTKNSQKKKNKWFDKSSFELKREVLRFGKLTSKFPSDPILRGTFFVIKKAYKKLVKTKKRSFKEFLLQKIASFESDNPKEFWEMVNESRQKSANHGDKIDAEEWFTYFRKLSTTHNSAKSGFEKLVDFNVSKIAEFAKSNEPILDEPITLEEIRKASTKLKTGKVAGNDSISNEMINSCVSIIGPVLQIFLYKKFSIPAYFPSCGRWVIFHPSLKWVI